MNEIFNEYFIIDSSDLSSVSTKLYGYCITDTGLIENNNYCEETKLTPNGAYVLVKKNEKIIEVLQDYMGSYGLYLYESGDRYIISNSFEYLLENIPLNCKLSFDKKYADYFLVADLSVHLCNSTMVKEIRLLDRNDSIEISLITKKLKINKIDYNENKVEINSEEGIKILDGWFHKWTSFTHNLSRQTNNIRVDLTGGFDSRMVFTIFLCSNINLEKIFVKSIESKEYTHPEDFKIASQIANCFGFKLNNSTNISTDHSNYSLTEIINGSIMPKLGIHKQMYFKKSHHSERRFTFAGGGGECYHGYWSNDFNEAYAHEIARSKVVSGLVSQGVDKSIKALLDLTIEKVQAMVPSYSLGSNEFGPKLYKETRSRYHYARAQVESYHCNEIILNPLLDYELGQLRCHDGEVAAIIYGRYKKELLSFNFEGGRTLSTHAMNALKMLDNVPPYSLNPSDSKLQIGNVSYEGNHKLVSDDELSKCIESMVNSEHVQSIFEKIYSVEILHNLINKCKRRTYNKLQEYFGILAICRCFDVCMLHSSVVSNFNSWMDTVLEPSLLCSRSLVAFCTARLDLKNTGQSSAVIVLSVTDDECVITKPDWFKGGIVVESIKGKIAIKIKINGNGQLDIRLRSKNVKMNNQQYPIWIDYEELIINEKRILLGTETVSHDSPYYHHFKVKDGEEYTIVLKWKPHKI